MKQYCRYCCHLVTGNGIWCDEQEREISESAAKSLNNCHSFAYNPMDAFDSDHEYSPREPKMKQCDGQIELFQEDK